jgi:hypothetical protein
MRVIRLPAGAYRLGEQVFVHLRLGATDPAYIVANDALRLLGASHNGQRTGKHSFRSRSTAAW